MRKFKVKVTMFFPFGIDRVLFWEYYFPILSSLCLAVHVKSILYRFSGFISNYRYRVITWDQLHSYRSLT